MDIYKPSAYVKYGARLVAYGIESWFLPWCWDGVAVWWGAALPSYDEALAVAKRYADEPSYRREARKPIG